MPQGGGATSGSTLSSSSDSEESASSKLFQSIREGTSWSGHENNICFLNRGNGLFSDISHASGFDFTDDGRGMAPIDWDHDGDLDIMISNRNAPQIRFLRNNVPNDGHHSVLIRLQGADDINRDAIGSRVSIFIEGQSPIIRTVRAGEGFQTQNTKWLHFGLGSNKSIQKVVVTWPNGKQQTYTDIAPNQRYILTYNEPSAKLSPSLQITWPAELTPLPPQTDEVEGRALTGSRLPLAPLPFKDFEGQQQSFRATEKADTLTLINFWGSWCTPCAIELNEFSRSAATLEKAGIKVLALAVDGLSGQQGSQADAQAFFKPLSKKLQAGFASQESLDKLKILHDLIFEKRGGLVLPTSLLIDAKGQVAGYYEGALTVEEILELKQTVKLERSLATLEQGMPFTGRWLAAPIDFKLSEYGDQLIKNGYFSDAGNLYMENKERFQHSPNLHLHLAKIGLEFEKNSAYRTALTFLEKATALQPQNATAFMSLGDRYYQYGLIREAKQTYQKAILIDSTLIRAHFNLGIIFMKELNYEEAIPIFLKCLEIDKNYINAHINLAFLYIQKHNNLGGIKHLKRVVEIDPKRHAAHFQLGQLYEAQKSYADAKATYLSLTKHFPDHQQALARLKALSEALKEQD